MGGNVNYEKSGNSLLKLVPPVPSTKKDEKPKSNVRKKKQLTPAQQEWDFIVKKFVKIDKIIWPRDLAVLHGLLKDFPDFRFWHIVPAAFQMNSMQGFLTQKAQDFLKIEWAKFNLQPVEHEPIILEPTPQCENRIYPPSRPRSILDFCKTHG